MHNDQTIADRITHDRLRSYLAATAANLEGAIELYDWNIRVGSALLEDLSRLEMVFRNTIDSALVAHGQPRPWRNVWYRRPQLFPGRPGARALDDIATARRRAKRGLFPAGASSGEINSRIEVECMLATVDRLAGA